MNFIPEDETHAKWDSIVEFLRRMGYVAISASSPANLTVNENGEKYVSQVETHGHTDILFSLLNSTVPRNYLSAVLREGE